MGILFRPHGPGHEHPRLVGDVLEVERAFPVPLDDSLEHHVAELSRERHGLEYCAVHRRMGKRAPERLCCRFFGRASRDGRRVGVVRDEARRAEGVGGVGRRDRSCEAAADGRIRRVAGREAFRDVNGRVHGHQLGGREMQLWLVQLHVRERHG
ncbi:hypothetical protein CLUG_02811 [Clavispora lusitaniae ATCC 42720]|uniref:Uncharacterized protein n=1 Tax=Clavispora lusitaniae (strain ATCC 42720) TaxID=306902 RepID=C4Y2P8_CLAL4|nr:uncharacterized protein CLUG_02811 [Clavispora lusitaniae ATCC 42720]EEQ38685.1 hypothetical protein CLUG_02811 [Clavispora lusitaniae ATCC 42720]